MMVGCASRPYGFGAGWLFPFNHVHCLIYIYIYDQVIKMSDLWPGPITTNKIFYVSQFRKKNICRKSNKTNTHIVMSKPLKIQEMWIFRICTTGFIGNSLTTALAKLFCYLWYLEYKGYSLIYKSSERSHRPLHDVTGFTHIKSSSTPIFVQ